LSSHGRSRACTKATSTTAATITATAATTAAYNQIFNIATSRNDKIITAIKSVIFIATRCGDCPACSDNCH